MKKLLLLMLLVLTIVSCSIEGIQEPIRGLDGIDGIDGEDGISSTITVITEEDGYWLVFFENNEETSRIFVSNGIDGTDGIDGVDGLNGTNGADGKDGVSSIVTTELVEVSEDYPNGGWRLIITIDGVVTSSVVIENGADGTNGLDGKDGKDGLNGRDGTDGEDGVDGEDGRDGVSVRVWTEPGENGTWLYIQEGDAIYITFIPDGADGKDGIDGINGYNTLIRHSQFKSSDQCPNGGILMEYGLDLDRDGILSDTEVTEFYEICKCVCEGDDCIPYYKIEEICCDEDQYKTRTVPECRVTGVRVTIGIVGQPEKEESFDICFTNNYDD